MKLFTVEEANDLLPVIRPKLEEIRARYASNASLRDSLKLAATAAADFGGGGLEGGTNYVKSLYKIGKITTELDELGVQLKDYSRGLIDFPSARNGQIVLLCWQLGEGERIEWWHETETGFAGRKPL
ncbi:MAG: DUF2203 domain-containing protein [Acidobacteriota bacterium]|nr:DUF2203 domain-containing protein [Acidobacteriota bacterium]